MTGRAGTDRSATRSATGVPASAATATGPAQATPAVRATGVGKTFVTKTGEVAALTGVDLAVAEGEFVSLIGPSGCGKSTLLRLIADLDTASAGGLEVFGKTPARARRDQDYGIAFQQAGLLDWRTVGANIALPLELHGVGATERAARVAELAELVGLTDFVDRHPDELSGGMQQRVAIARAVAYQPEVLIMDEPFAAVDAQTRADLEDLVRTLHRERGMSILFVTHDIDESVYLGERVVVLSKSPTWVQEDLHIDLPEDRDQITTRAMPRFTELRTHVYEQIQRAKRGEAVRAQG